MQPLAEIVVADLNRPDHQQDVLSLTRAFALDPMGGGKALPDAVCERLIPGLRSHPTTLILLACVEGRAVGMAICFLGFSSFLALPLLNVHDLFIADGFRGRGIGRQLLNAVEQQARALGCGKVSLEVYEHNAQARQAYAAAGFAQAGIDDPAGGALFYTKVL